MKPLKSAIMLASVFGAMALAIGLICISYTESYSSAASWIRLGLYVLGATIMGAVEGVFLPYGTSK